MKVLGLEFAPLNIPFERRLQTAAAVIWPSCFLFLGFGSLFVSIILLFTPYYYISLLYAVWFWYDHKQSQRGGRRWSFVRKLKVWNYLRDYFPIYLVKTDELDPHKNYICGYHPHGIMCAGAFANFGTEATGFSKTFPGIRPSLLTLEGQFWFPFYREFLLAIGACSVSRSSLNWLLTNEGKGNAIFIVIGGAAEALDAHPGLVRLTLKRRKGFVRLALKHGASLLPVFSFGENELFSQVSNEPGTFLRDFQNFLTKLLGVSPPIFHGRGIFQYNFGIVPYRKPIHTVVGSPIDVEKIANPSEVEINRIHNLYMDKLKILFDEYKVKYEGYEKMELQFI